MEKNLFEIATREKYVYNVNGLVKTEDLYDLSLTKLDALYRNMKKELKELDGDSLLGESKDFAKATELNNKCEIVKYIVEYKQELAEAKVNALKKKETANRIKELIAEKKNEELVEKSVEELEAMLAEL
jgi:hypothetical protein